MSNVLAIIGLTFLALAIVGVVCMVTDVLYGGSATVAYTLVIAALFAVLWYTVPLVMRARGGDDAA